MMVRTMKVYSHEEPLMMAGLALGVYGNDTLLVLTIVGANLTTLGVVLFVINVWKNVKETPQSE
ncbi:hypothetical protein [Sutcliffiella sp. FSL R7-0096]|uniref:hypothetical protein n=1 Tax=Sutcliffiella sp. FSL R7-0096 TaxID=2921670 RepID=UPI00315AA8C6